MRLADLSRAAERAGADLTAAAGILARLTPDAGALPVTVPGRLGELARTLDAQIGAAVAARSREAATHGARFADAAAVLRLVAAGYAEADAEARRRQEGGG